MREAAPAGAAGARAASSGAEPPRAMPWPAFQPSPAGNAAVGVTEGPLEAIAAGTVAAAVVVGLGADV